MKILPDGTVTLYGTEGGIGNGTGNGTDTIGNNWSWSVSLSRTSMIVLVEPRSTVIIT